MTMPHQSCWKMGTSTTSLKHALGMTLGVFLFHVLSCTEDFDSGCWEELMDDETSSRYIFLLMLLLIPFLLIGLSIKALTIMQPNISSLMIKLLYFERSRQTNKLPIKYLLTVFFSKRFLHDVILQLHLRKT